MDLSHKYSNLMKNIWMTCTYCSIIPLALPLLVANLVMSYLADKYLLLRRYVRPKRMNSNLHHQIVESFEYTPLFLAIGDLFARFANNDAASLKLGPLHFVMLFFALLNIFLPMSSIIKSVQKKFNKKNKVTEQKPSYEEA